MIYIQFSMFPRFLKMDSSYVSKKAWNFNVSSFSIFNIKLEIQIAQALNP